MQNARLRKPPDCGIINSESSGALGKLLMTNTEQNPIRQSDRTFLTPFQGMQHPEFKKYVTVLSDRRLLSSFRCLALLVYSDQDYAH